MCVIIRTTMMKMMLEELEGEYKKGEYDSNKLYSSLTSCLLQGVKSKVYNPLMERPKCGEYIFSNTAIHIVL